jgi:hypothetical protein
LDNSKGQLHIFDTLYDNLDQQTDVLLEYIFGKKMDPKVIKIPRQQGYNDCVFAISITTSFACFGSLPPSWFGQSLMRPHLVQCFEKGSLSPFPVCYE